MSMWRRGTSRASTTLVVPQMGRVTLLAITEHGCRLQERANAVLAQAAHPGEHGAALAREGGYLAGEYHRLYSWVSDTPADFDGAATASAAAQRTADDPAIVADRDDSELQRELAQLLMYHCQVLHYALRLAFPKYRAPIGDDHRRAVCLDLGEPAQRLHDLAEQLREQP